MIKSFLVNRSLLVRFTIISLFLTLLIAVGLGWRLESMLERDALSAVAENTAEQATNILDKHITTSDLETSMQGKRYDEINTLIHSTLLSANIVRIKIWNPDGLLIYSDDKNIVGQTFPPSEEIEKALTGEIATEISSLD